VQVWTAPRLPSNIRELSRLQLLVEVLQRVYRMLNEEDQEDYKNDFKPSLQGTSGQYVYRIKGEEVADHLRPIGELMHRLVESVYNLPVLSQFHLGKTAGLPKYRLGPRISVQRILSSL